MKKSWPLIVCGLLACTNPKQASEKDSAKPLKSLEQASWLVGSWSNISTEGSSYEVWRKYNDTLLLGRSYFIRGADTVSSEYIKLVQQGNDVNYIPTVPDQNKGLPVAFKLIFVNDSKMVFENLEHDFPQTIAYQHLAPDSMLAEISGMIKGEYRAQQFPMSRTK